MTMEIIKPQVLQTGDRIGIVTPSGPVVAHRKYLEEGIKNLEDMGFKVVLGKHVFEKKGYMAGSDEERAEDLNNMFKDPDIKAILCSRGGEDAMRLLPLIDYGLIQQNPKIFLGMSDITVLLNAIHAKTGLVTFHGPSTAWGINCSPWGCKGMEPYSKAYFLKALTHNEPIGKIEPKTKWHVYRNGKARGRLLGGNLDSIEKISGTEYEPDWRGAILFFEELDESVEEMDRDLMPLKLRGVLGKISGMVIGHLEDCIENEKEEKEFEEMVKEITKEYDFPILKMEEFGHHEINITLPLGIEVEINGDEFSLLESAVTGGGLL